MIKRTGALPASMKGISKLPSPREPKVSIPLPQPMEFCNNEDCDSNHICMEQKGHKGACFQPSTPALPQQELDKIKCYECGEFVRSVTANDAGWGVCSKCEKPQQEEPATPELLKLSKIAYAYFSKHFLGKYDALPSGISVHWECLAKEFQAATEPIAPLLEQEEPTDFIKDLTSYAYGKGSTTFGLTRSEALSVARMAAELTQALTSLAAAKSQSGFEKNTLIYLAAAQELAEDRYDILYNIGCRESCTGWVNERAELAESKLSEALQTIQNLEKELGR